MSLRRRMSLLEESEGEEEMDNWETIIDWTAESDVMNKFFTTDDNGKPFKLKKLSIFIHTVAPTDEACTNLVGIDAFLGNDIKAPARAIGQTPKYGETSGLIYAEFIRTSYGLYPVIIDRSVNNGSVNNQFYSFGSIATGMKVNSDFDIIETPEYCEAIGIGSYYYNHSLPAGTRIRIKGVRA